MRKVPYFLTYSEVARWVALNHSNKSLRPGQALCNKYNIPEQLANRIYEETDQNKVCQRVFNFFVKEDYQNTPF